jgi:hypothetical protein
VVDVQISLRGDSAQAADLEALDDWLRGETQLAGRVRLLGRRPVPTELGTLADVLVVAAGSGGVLSVLATSLRTWLSQPRRSDIRILVQVNSGRSVELVASRVDPEEVERLLRQLVTEVE